jgi:hypothetical protein
MKKFIATLFAIAAMLSIFAIFLHESTATVRVPTNTVVRVPTIPVRPIILRELVIELCFDCNIENSLTITRLTTYCSETRQWLVSERRTTKNANCNCTALKWQSTVPVEIDMSKMPNIGSIVNPHESFDERNASLRQAFRYFINIEMSGVDLSDFTFERGWYRFWRVLDTRYKGIRFLSEKYFFVLHEFDDGRVRAVGGIWDERHFENAHNLELEPVISREEAVRIAYEFSDSLAITCRCCNEYEYYWINDGMPTLFPANDPKITELVVYCLERLIVAYEIIDEITEDIFPPRYSYLERLEFTVYVDIATGEILSHGFELYEYHGG